MQENRAQLGPSKSDNWEIPREKIRLMGLLGKGQFGRVHLGYWKGKTKVAIKEVNDDNMSAAEFMDEAALMKRCNDPNIVTLLGVCTVNGPIYIILEYMSKGCLLDWLYENHQTGVKMETLFHIAQQVASGMKHLESINLIHKDLGAKNILLGENDIAKISDFGLARLAPDQYYYTDSRFSSEWTALEAILDGKFSIKSDVWSYGVTLMEIFTYGSMPYSGMPLSQTIKKLKKGYRMPKPQNYNLPHDIYEIMLSCWHKDPSKRPTFEYLAHYFEKNNVSSELLYREVGFE